MTIKRWGTLATLGALLLGSATANAAWRWPWESPKKPAATATPAAKPTVGIPIPTMVPNAPAAPSGNEQSMIQQLHDVYSQEIANAKLAVSKGSDSRVKSYASKILSEDQAFDSQLQARAKAIGYSLQNRQNVAGTDFASLSGPAFDAAFLSRSLQDLSSIRASFASFKEQESDRGFHSQLSTAFDQLVAQHEEAKALHDQIRNSNRGSVGNY